MALDPPVAPSQSAPVRRVRNPGRIRAHNRRVVLDILRACGPLGRPAIAPLAQLSPQAVANILDELIADGLIRPAGRLRQGRGQPPRQYAVNPSGAFTIGIELAVAGQVTAAVDLGGTVLLEEIEHPASAGPGTLLPHIAARIARLRATLPGRLMGIGLVMPRATRVERLDETDPAALPGWAGIDAAAELSALAGAPVEVDNDANAAAIGETQIGAGQGLSDVAVLYFGTGIGLGIVANGTLLRGAFGHAGEIGHVVVEPGGRPCPCGQRGCLERYASLHALRERLSAEGLPHGLDDLAALAEAARPIAEWTEVAARTLSTAIGLIETLLDPQTVILSGSLPEHLLDALIARLDLPPSRDDRQIPRVIRGRTGRTTAALGAASLPLYSATTLGLRPAPLS